jgi:hypothetical protein
MPMPSLLSNTQKAEIGQLAAQAWQVWEGREGFLEANGELSKSACFSAWRHWQQGLACGRQSLRECTGDDYQLLRAHFLKLAGLEASARRAEERHISNPQRIAAYKLRQALAAAGLPEAYAGAICRRQYRCALADASERQLWCLVFTVRNRRTANRREARGERREEGAAA